MTGAVLALPVSRAIEDSKVSPGVLGFLVVAALGVATWLLIRSMNRQLHRIDFSEDAIDLERHRPQGTDSDIGVEAGSAESDGVARGVADGDEGRGGDPGSGLG